MNTNQKLGYMVGGGALVAVGMAVAAFVVSPVTAQRDKFDTIQCSRLVVVDADSKMRISLGVDEHGGRVDAYGNDGKSGVILRIEEEGGVVAAHGKDGESSAVLGIFEYGGIVGVGGKDGKSRASLSIAEHGGHVEVFGKAKGTAVMAINEYGNGAVSTWDKNGYRQ